MSLTAHSDIMGRFHESAFNIIIAEILAQRPSISNYATKRIINSNKYCTPIELDPVLANLGVEKCSEIDKIPIFGSDESSGLDFCLQLKELKIDFGPSSEIELPPELGTLNLQQFALKGTVCAGIGCTQSGFNVVERDSRFNIRGTATERTHIKPISLGRNITNGLNFLPIDLMKMNCFCLSFYVKMVVQRDDTHLKLKLSGIEIEDITPIGLENAIECYLKEVLDHTVFPKIQIALEDLIFNVDSYFDIGPTPTSIQLPYNPDVSNNYLSVYLNIN